MNSAAPKFVIAGVIVRPHGVRGVVKVRAATDEVEHFSRLKHVQLQRGEQVLGDYHIAQVQFVPEGILLSFHEVHDRNQAELLRGAELMIPLEAYPPKSAEQFYHFELIGLPVYGTANEYLGEIVEIKAFPANDVWVIRNGKEEKLVPAIDSVIREVDLANRRVVISPLPGLFEDAE